MGKINSFKESRNRFSKHSGIEESILEQKSNRVLINSNYEKNAFTPSIRHIKKKSYLIKINFVLNSNQYFGHIYMVDICNFILITYNCAFGFISNLLST